MMPLDQLVHVCCQALALIVMPTNPVADPPANVDGLIWRHVECPVSHDDATQAIKMLCQDASSMQPALTQFYRLPLLGPDLGVKQYRADSPLVSVRLTRYYRPIEKIVFDYMAR